MNIGGAERDRTADPLLAKQVLSQLSYSPNQWNYKIRAWGRRVEPLMLRIRLSIRNLRVEDPASTVPEPRPTPIMRSTWWA